MDLNSLGHIEKAAILTIEETENHVANLCGPLIGRDETIVLMYEYHLMRLQMMKDHFKNDKGLFPKFQDYLFLKDVEAGLNQERTK